MQKNYSAIRYQKHRKEGVKKGRYVAAPEKQLQASFEPGDRQLAPDMKRTSAWGRKYRFAIEDLDWINIPYGRSSESPLWPSFASLKKSSDWGPDFFSSFRLRSGFTDIVHHYEGKLSRVETSSELAQIERTLAEANDNREVIATLTKHECLGLQLLAHIRASGRLRLSEMVSKARVDWDQAASIMARLVRGKAVIVDDVSFVCTERGLIVLQNLERNTGVILTPEDPSAD